MRPLAVAVIVRGSTTAGFGSSRVGTFADAGFSGWSNRTRTSTGRSPLRPRYTTPSTAGTASAETTRGPPLRRSRNSCEGVVPSTVSNGSVNGSRKPLPARRRGGGGVGCGGGGVGGGGWGAGGGGGGGGDGGGGRGRGRGGGGGGRGGRGGGGAAEAGGRPGRRRHPSGPPDHNLPLVK